MAKLGDDLEKIVELIERSISPSSVIRQNVMLPVLNSQTGRTRQCDVVIESGPEFRRNGTIVEVQDRKSQVNIATFNDWLQKLDDVGANGLICISRNELRSVNWLRVLVLFDCQACRKNCQRDSYIA